MIRHPKAGRDGLATQSVNNVSGGVVLHGSDNAKLVSISQANIMQLGQINWPDTMGPMAESDKPFADIADRLRWHRSIEGMTQAEYAERLGIKRSAYSLWEAGSHRLSLDGALLLRRRYGLSLDFMYEGVDETLPMTLRHAWRDRPLVNHSK